MTEAERQATSFEQSLAEVQALLSLSDEELAVLAAKVRAFARDNPVTMTGALEEIVRRSRQP